MLTLKLVNSAGQYSVFKRVRTKEQGFMSQFAPVKGEKVRLSTIVEKLNERFGTDFTETDFLSREQVKKDMLKSEDIQEKAKNNTKENFKFAFEKSFMDFIIEAV
jgi:hypothetical protein